MRVLFASLLVGLAASPAGQEPPLPDLPTFAAEVRKRLESDDIRQSGYVFVQTQREQKLDASGRVTKETVDVFESYPALPGESRWHRVTIKDGRPLTASELEKQDRERQQKVLEYARKLEREPDKVRAAEAKKLADRRRETEQAVNDIFLVYDMKMLGREVVNGYQTIVVSFTPRRNARPRTREGGVMKHFAGKVWVSETEYELVRVEAEAIDTASFGLGLLARVHKGSRASFERQKVNGEAWLPSSAAYTASARVFLVRRLRVGGTLEFSNYRKFTVDTETRVSRPPG
jgi:hypothetical protein